MVFLSFFSNKKLKKIDLNIFQLSFVLNKDFTDEMFSKILITLNKNCKEIDFISMSSEKNDASIHFEVHPNSIQSISKINKEFKGFRFILLSFESPKLSINLLKMKKRTTKTSMASQNPNPFHLTEKADPSKSPVKKK